MIAALFQIIDVESRTWKDPHLEAVVNYQARDNYQKNNFRVCLKELLKEAGHSISSLTTPDDACISREREEILIARAKKIAEAKDITKEAAEALMLKMESTSEERWQIEKALLKDKLPGVELTPEFIYWCKYDKPQILSQLKLYWHWKNKGSAENADRKKWVGALKYNTPIWDIRCSSLQLAVIDELNLHQFFDGSEYTNDDPKVLNFFHNCLTQHKERLKLALRINLTPEYGAVRLIKHILDKVAINFSGKQRRLASGERQRFYTPVLPESTVFGQQVLKAYDLRFANFINQQTTTGPLIDEASQTGFIGNYPISEPVTNNIQPTRQPDKITIPTNTGPVIDEASQVSFIGNYQIAESVTNHIEKGTATSTGPVMDEVSQASLLNNYSISESVTNSSNPIVNTGIQTNIGTVIDEVSQTSLLDNDPIVQSVTNISVEPVEVETIQGFTYVVRELLAGVYEVDNVWKGICDLFDGITDSVKKGVWQLLNLNERQRILNLQQG